MTELSEHDLQEHYLALMKDTDLDRLELELNEPNIFSILAIDNMEIRHSNFLAWLLNPKGNHGLNDLFLKRFLREIFFDKKIKEVNPLDAETLDYRRVEIRREWQHIDLLISFPNLVICIENKVRAKDNGKQLTTYKEIIEEEFPEDKFKQVFIHLTPYGSSSSHERERYAFISYSTIINILDRILQVYDDLISHQATYYIRDYIKSIKRNLMRTDTTNQLAREIYLNHKKLLDFIYNNRPDHSDEFTKLLEGFLKKNEYILGSKSKNFIRFLPSEIHKIVPKYKKAKSGWVKREAFLFELQVSNRNTLVFKITSAPAGSNNIFKNKLSEVLQGLDGVRRIDDNGWQVFFSKSIELKIEEQMIADPKKMPDGFEGFWGNDVLPLIQKVEGAIMPHLDELSKLKQQIVKQ